MPELPDLAVYQERLDALVGGRVLERIRLLNPFVLRTALPRIESAEGKRVRGARRLGKRIVLALDNDLFLVFHLMRAGRLRWITGKTKPPGRITLALFVFAEGTLAFTEAGTRRSASLHLVEGEAALAQFDAGGMEIAGSALADFAARLRSENHTLKRALTAPHLFSGIGGAYSDEILHRARLSPIALTSSLDDGAVARLHAAARDVLAEWTERLRAEAGVFPKDVTAFREGMAVHGRYGKPCPDCGTPVQRIVYAERETNYCPTCQTGGKVLADRALSKLLHASWPRTVEELG